MVIWLSRLPNAKNLPLPSIFLEFKLNKYTLKNLFNKIKFILNTHLNLAYYDNVKEP